MGKFHKYGLAIDEYAREIFGKYAKLKANLDTAQTEYSLNPRKSIGDSDQIREWNRLESDLQNAKAEYNSFMKSLPGEVAAKVRQIRVDFDNDFDKTYQASASAVDQNVLELLRSGILTPAEYKNLIQTSNHTMARIIASHALQRAENELDSQIKAEYRAASYTLPNGSEYKTAMDCLETTLARTAKNPGMIPYWEELTAKALDTL